MNRPIKFEIKLRALKDTKSGYKKGEECMLKNDIFDRNTGIAFFDIGLEWEIVYRRQFTGLTDKNGKEYYEADILDNKEVVEFRDGCYFAGGTPLAISASHREIIGNKFENPELLS